MTEISEKIRMKAVEFPNPKGTVLQLNHVVKLREPGKSFGSIHVNLTSLESLRKTLSTPYKTRKHSDKAAFAFGIITYRKTGWPKEYRLRTNVR